MKRLELARISSSRHVVYRRLWVPGQRAEPDFPLNPRWLCWTISRGLTAGLPAARIAASDPNSIIPASIATLRIVTAQWPRRATASMSLLRITLRLIVGVDIPATIRKRAWVIRCRSPLTAQQFDLTQFFQRSTSPGLAAIRRIETTLACAAVITEHSQLALAITSQPV